MTDTRETIAKEICFKNSPCGDKPECNDCVCDEWYPIAEYIIQREAIAEARGRKEAAREIKSKTLTREACVMYPSFQHPDNTYVMGSTITKQIMINECDSILSEQPRETL